MAATPSAEYCRLSIAYLSSAAAASVIAGEFGVGIDTAELERSVHASVDAGTERLAGLVSLDYLETGNRQVGGGNRIGPTGFTSESARVAVSYTPDESSNWILDFQYGRQPKTPRIDELVPGFGESEPASDEFFFAPNERLFTHLRHMRQDGWLAVDWIVDLGWQRIVDDRRSRNFAADVRRIEDNASDLYGASVTASKEYFPVPGLPVPNTIMTGYPANVLRSVSQAVSARKYSHDFPMDRMSARARCLRTCPSMQRTGRP